MSEAGFKTTVDPGTYHPAQSLSAKNVNERAGAIACRLWERATIACNPQGMSRKGARSSLSSPSFSRSFFLQADERSSLIFAVLRKLQDVAQQLQERFPRNGLAFVRPLSRCLYDGLSQGRKQRLGLISVKEMEG